MVLMGFLITCNITLDFDFMNNIETYRLFTKKQNLGDLKNILDWLIEREVDFEKLKIQVLGAIQKNSTEDEPNGAGINSTDLSGFAPSESEQASLKKMVEQLNEPTLIYECVLQTQKRVLRMEKALATGAKKNDKVMLQKLVEFRAETIRRLEEQRVT